MKWILLVFLAGRSLAPIAFLAEGKVQVVATVADPIAFSRHRGDDQAVM